MSSLWAVITPIIAPISPWEIIHTDITGGKQGVVLGRESGNETIVVGCCVRLTGALLDRLMHRVHIIEAHDPGKHTHSHGQA